MFWYTSLYLFFYGLSIFILKRIKMSVCYFITHHFFPHGLKMWRFFCISIFISPWTITLMGAQPFTVWHLLYLANPLFLDIKHSLKIFSPAKLPKSTVAEFLSRVQGLLIWSLITLCMLFMKTANLNSNSSLPHSFLSVHFQLSSDYSLLFVNFRLLHGDIKKIAPFISVKYNT